MGTKVLTMLEPLWQGFPPVDPLTVSGSVSCTLPPHYESVSCARKFTRETMRGWELDDDLFDSVSLVVSELVTNALRHAILAAPEHADATPPARLHLMRWSQRLICAVRDPSDDSPVATGGEVDSAAESGRGLYLVESFSDGWGWHPLSGVAHGKIVWALFRLP
ncbi:putative regulatory protein [Streptomyces sp. NBRC 110611]|uniref:ATP-binding protein n=1 Tax=Streptomyces sp. NBRC 110611 TaxID=1621259 RepID=UPI0008350D79|nr:ATP-binding protein [Streptomyces sp. NBRC 110611]GAU68819.1 putative regulatory protein [Streptomyces sp. NBRC 110611]